MGANCLGYKVGDLNISSPKNKTPLKLGKLWYEWHNQTQFDSEYIRCQDDTNYFTRRQ